jgi:hypothetical protein
MMDDHVIMMTIWEKKIRKRQRKYRKYDEIIEINY